MKNAIISNLRPQLLGRMTQRAVVEALKSQGPISRADIARLTGISPTTVSSAVTQVLLAGYIEETEAEISGPGRPGKILRLAHESVQVIGVSVEPEWCEMVVGGLDGSIYADRSLKFLTPNTYARLLSEIERHAKPWIDTPNVQTLGLGLSLPGIIDPSGERAVFSPNFHQTDEQRPSHDLRNRLGFSTILIQENDALCLAERRAHLTEDIAVIDYGGGLGLGVITGGRLLGRHVGLPRELGHITIDPHGAVCGCGNRGCLETLATDATFATRVSAKVGRLVTIDEAIRLATDNPVAFHAEVEAVLDYLAIAVAATANLFAPPLIIMHGRLLSVAPNLLDCLTARAATRKLRPLREKCRLMVSTSTKAQGALAGILDHLFEELGPLVPTNA